MGFWFTFFLWAATFVLSDYFRPKLPSVESSGEGDFQSPTATEGRKIPQVVGGTVKVKGPNTLWQGDWDAEPVTVETGLIFKRDETVGYKYSIALALGQFQGECAGMTAIFIGDDKVWDYVTDNSSNPGTVADIDLPELFGGERSGGGFQGRVRCFTGANDQPVSTYLQDRIPLQSRWPGFTYVVITNLTETGGAIIGESNQLRNIRVEFQMFNATLENGLNLTGNKHYIGRDANPISAAYKVLNDPDWGIATNDVNFTNFQTVADTCYTEGIGYSQLVDNETEAYAILAEIEKHIDGYIGPNPTTGLIEVKLARDDYTPASEYQATTANIIDIKNYAKPEWPQTKNEVKIRFVNREKNYNDDHAVAQDMAGRLITGRPQSITIRFPGLRDADAANRMVARTSRAYFWPLSKFEMEVDRSAYALRPGDIAIVTHPDINATDLPVRITRVRTGDPVNQTIKLDVVEDIFGDEVGIQAAPPASGWTPATSAPVAISNYDTVFAPRWLMAYSDQAIEPRLMYLIERDVPNNGWNLQYRYRLTAFGGNFELTVDEGPFTSFVKYGTIRGYGSPEVGMPQLRASANNGTASLAGGGGMYVDGDLASLAGTYNPQDQGDGLLVINPGALNEEFCAMQTAVIDGAGIQITGLFRGIGDSPIFDHDPGEPVWFIDEGVYMQPWVVPGDTSIGYQYALQPIAPDGEGTMTGFFGEMNLNDVGYRLPNPPTAVICDQLSTSVWYALGDIDLSIPNSYTAPSSQGCNFEVWNREHDESVQRNPFLAANSVDDDNNIYATNYFSDRGPTLKVWVYNLDATPDPNSGFGGARTNAIFSTVTGVLDDRTNQYFLNQSDIAGLGGAAPDSPFNARIEFAWENTFSPGIAGVLAGVESRSVWIDRQVFFEPEEHAYATMEQTLLLLHFEGSDGTTQVLDYSTYNHPVTLTGGVEIDTTVPDDQASPEGAVWPAGHLIVLPASDFSPVGFCEVADVSPKVFSQLNVDDGFMMQVRVRFTATPSGEIPLIAKWRTSDNERAFWLGLNNTTLRMKWSVDGTSELIETTGTRTWNLDQWYEITATVSEDYVQFFVDGVFDEAEFQSWGNTPHDSAAPIRIGADGDGNTVPATTYIDEVRILNFGLYKAPWTKVTTHYAGRERINVLLCNWEQGADGDKAYNSDDLNRYPILFPTGTGVTEIDDAQSKFGTKSLYCGGLNVQTFANSSGVIIPDTQWTGIYEQQWDFGYRDFTFECFVRFEVLPTTQGTSALIAKWKRGGSPNAVGSEQNNRANYYFIWGSANQLSFTYNINSAIVTLTSPVQSIAINTWYHCAAVRKDGVLSLFFEGNRIAQDLTGFNGLWVRNHNASGIALGRLYANSNSTTWALKGWLDEVRVINGLAAYDGATYTVPTASGL
jgi:hypothetical protein